MAEETMEPMRPQAEVGKKPDGKPGKKKKRALPDTFVILAICLVVVAIAGVFVSLSTPDVAMPTLANVLNAPVEGFASAMGVCVFVIVLGGFLGIVNETKSLDVGVAALIRALRGHELVLIPVLMLLFGLGGSTYGMMEETVPFYILLAATMFAAGFDTLTGALVVLLGAGAGCIGSTVNPFAVGVASAALTDMGIQVSQGEIILLGLVLFVIAEGVSIFFVMRYARKVMRDKGSTFMSLQEQQAAAEEFGKGSSAMMEARLTGIQKVVLILFGFTFVVMIVGFVPWQDFGITLFMAGASGEDLSGAWSSILTGMPLGTWYFGEATTWFLLMAIVIGVVSRMGSKKLVGTFMRGCADMVSTALVLAFARGIAVLMANIGLDAFLLENAAGMLAGVPAAVFGPGSFLVFFFMSFLVPSSSGLATLSMPIMGPLAATLGFSPEVMVMMYVAAHGVVMLFSPINAVMLAGLGLAKVDYATAMRAIWKPVVIITVLCVGVLTAAMAF